MRCLGPRCCVSVENEPVLKFVIGSLLRVPRAAPVPLSLPRQSVVYDAHAWPPWMPFGDCLVKGASSLYLSATEIKIRC